MVAELITPLMPGAGPPPTTIPTVSFSMVRTFSHLSHGLCKKFLSSFLFSPLIVSPWAGLNASPAGNGCGEC
jgi:hypothetical protein